MVRRGEVAQLGEHRLRKAGVEGSNPFFSTNQDFKDKKVRKALSQAGFLRF